MLDGRSLRLVGVDQRRRDHADGHAGRGAPGGADADRQHLGQRRHAGAAGAPAAATCESVESPPPAAAEREAGQDPAGGRAAGRAGSGPAARAPGRPRPPGPPGRRAASPGSWRRRAGARAAPPPRSALASPSQKAESSGPQLGAAAAVLAAGEQAAEALPALGQAAVDFGLAEAGDLADLGVGVALGEQGQGAQLLRLQRLQRLAAAGDRFAALGPLGGPVAARRGSAPPSPRAPASAAAAAGPPRIRSRSRRTASASCLTTVCVQRISSRGSLGGRFGEEDLQRPLAGRRRRRRRRASSAARCGAGRSRGARSVSTAARLRAASSGARRVARSAPSTARTHHSAPLRRFRFPRPKHASASRAVTPFSPPFWTIFRRRNSRKLQEIWPAPPRPALGPGSIGSR